METTDFDSLVPRPMPSPADNQPASRPAPDATTTDVVQNLVQQCPTVIWVKDDQHRYRHVNDAFLNFLGTSLADAIGHTDHDLLPADTADELQANDNKVLEEGKSIRTIERVPGADGVMRHWLVQKTPVPGSNGKTWTGGMATDITEWDAAKQALHEKEALLRTVTEDAGIGLAMVDREYRYLYANPAYARILDLNAAGLIGQLAPDILGPVFEQKIKPNADRAFAGERVRYELQIPKRPDWTADRWFEVVYEPPASDSADACLLVVIVDISELRTAEAEAKEGRRWLEKAQQIGHIGSWEVGLAPVEELKWSKETCRIFGVDPDQFNGTSSAFVNILDPADRDRVLNRGRQAGKDKRPYDIEYRILRNGETRWIHQHADVECDSDGTPRRLIGVVQDITDRRRAEEKIRASEERHRLVAKATRDPIWELDTRTGDVSWNETYDRMFGIRPEETKDSWDWWTDRINADEREHVAQSLKRALADPQAEYWAEEYHFRDIHGEELLIQDRAFISRDEDGKPLRIVGTMRDQTHTERAMKEREALLRDIQEAQKLESLGVLAGGIAHDFNNLLTAILGNAGLLLQSTENQSDRELLSDVERSAIRAAELCQQMLAYAGKGQFVIKECDLSATVHEMVQLIEVSLGKHTRLQLDLDPNLPSVRADVSQLNQIIMNLVINGSEAIGEEGGTVSLRTGVVDVDEHLLAARSFDPKPAPGRYVSLDIRDNGSGMDPATRERIFEPFYTTKFTGRGLGLAAVLGIVRSHKGGLSLTSEPGIGTEFCILIPASEPGSRTATAKNSGSVSEDARSIRSPRLLLIDDEEPVRRTAQRILETLGYEVTVAIDGAEGVETFSNHARDLDLILLDLAMPRLGGAAVLKEIRSRDQDIPVILMSGFNEDAATENFDAKDLAGFIKKPFSVESLGTVVKTALRQ